MCSHYQAPQDRKSFASHFKVDPTEDMGKYDVWPGYPATFIRKASKGNLHNGTSIQREVLTGLFGLVPRWSTDVMIGRRTYNARTETVASKPSFRDAWKNAQHCIIPADPNATKRSNSLLKRHQATGITSDTPIKTENR